MKAKTVTFRADPEVIDKFKNAVKTNGAKSVTAVLEYLMIAYGNGQIDIRPRKQVDVILHTNN